MIRPIRPIRSCNLLSGSIQIMPNSQLNVHLEHLANTGQLVPSGPAWEAFLAAVGTSLRAGREPPLPGTGPLPVPGGPSEGGGVPDRPGGPLVPPEPSLVGRDGRSRWRRASEQPFLGYMHPEDKGRYLNALTYAMETGEDAVRGEFRFARKDGGHRWVELYNRITADQDGVVVGSLRHPQRHHRAQALRSGARHHHLPPAGPHREHAGGHPGGDPGPRDRPHQRDLLPPLRGPGAGPHAGGEQRRGTAGPVPGAGPGRCGGGAAPHGDPEGRRHPQRHRVLPGGRAGALHGFRAHHGGDRLLRPLLAVPRHHRAQAGRGGDHPGRRAAGVEELGAGAGPGQGPGALEPEVGLPGQHEPRDPHAHERHHRHDRACSWRPPSRRSSGSTPRPCAAAPTACCGSSTTSWTSPRSRRAS